MRGHRRHQSQQTEGQSHEIKNQTCNVQAEVSMGACGAGRLVGVWRLRRMVTPVLAQNIPTRDVRNPEPQVHTLAIAVEPHIGAGQPGQG